MCRGGACGDCRRVCRRGQRSSRRCVQRPLHGNQRSGREQPRGWSLRGAHPRQVQQIWNLSRSDASRVRQAVQLPGKRRGLHEAILNHWNVEHPSMPVDTRLKALRGTCAPLVCMLLILGGTAQETTGRALRATVPAGAVQKGPSLGLAAPRGPLTKGPSLGWCATHPSAPVCRGARYPCHCWGCPPCPPVRRLP
jgi:hypothetical protein